MSYQTIRASAHQTGLPAKSVHVICTSAPYRGLRAYDGDQAVEWPTVEYAPMPGLPPIRIQGCEPGCVHEWGDTVPAYKPGQVPQTNTGGKHSPAAANGQTGGRGAYCIHCGGWRGALGLEPDINAYIGHLILVLRELWRVLRDDGTLWFNISDSYSGSGGAHTFDHASPGLSKSASRDGVHKYKPDGGRAPDKKVDGLRPKNLMGVPQRFFLAAQAEGWIMRSAMPWIKRNGMPESVTDRPAQVVESIFLMAKQERYYWDGEAVKEPIVKGAAGSTFTNGKTGVNGQGRVSQKERNEDLSGRNFRSSDLFFKTWQGLLTSDAGDPLAMVINPVAFKGSHFAAFPPLLPEIAIKAGSSQYGCCPKCGAPWERVVEREGETTTEKRQRLGSSEKRGEGGKLVVQNLDYAGGHGNNTRQTVTTGWRPTCQCGVRSEVACESCRGACIDVLWAAGFEPMTNEGWTEAEEDHPCPACDGTGKRLADAAPCVVLDPFAGSGTTLRVALALGRKPVGVDISDQYLENLVPERTSNVQIEMAF